MSGVLRAITGGASRSLTGTRRTAGGGIPTTQLGSGKVLPGEVTDGPRKGQLLLPGFTRHTGKVGSHRMKRVIGRGMGGRVSTSEPPFKGSPASGGRSGSGDPRAQVVALARSEELSMKAKVAGQRARRDGPVHGPKTFVQAIKSELDMEFRKGKTAKVAGERARRRADADAAVSQQNRMDEAQKAGQITDREIIKQNRILMRRRKRAGI